MYLRYLIMEVWRGRTSPNCCRTSQRQAPASGLSLASAWMAAFGHTFSRGSEPSRFWRSLSGSSRNRSISEVVLLRPLRVLLRSSPKSSSFRLPSLFNWNFRISASLNAADTAVFSGFLTCSGAGGAKKSNSSCSGSNRAMLSLHVVLVGFAEIWINGAFLGL